LLRRTLRRVVSQEELWNGNRESWRMMLSRDSILLWFLHTYWRRRREYPALLSLPKCSICKCYALARLDKLRSGCANSHSSDLIQHSTVGETKMKHFLIAFGAIIGLLSGCNSNTQQELQRDPRLPSRHTSLHSQRRTH
jgi:hypothetical protein